MCFIEGSHKYSVNSKGRGKRKVNNIEKISREPNDVQRIPGNLKPFDYVCSCDFIE